MSGSFEEIEIPRSDHPAVELGDRLRVGHAQFRKHLLRIMEQDGIHPHVHGGVPQEIGVPEPQTFVYPRDELVVAYPLGPGRIADERRSSGPSSCLPGNGA